MFGTNYKIGILFAAALLLAGCDKMEGLFSARKPAAKPSGAGKVTVKGTVIAKVNNIPITLEDLNQEIEFYNLNVPADKPEEKITTRQQRVDYVKNELVRRALLYQEALDRGLDREEEVQEALEKAKMNMLVVELVKKETQDINVSSKDIENYYNTYKEQLREPEERAIREILLSTEQEAKDALIQLLQGADFATLAKERSKATSARDGGDLGYIPKGKKSTQFDAVAFSDSLEVGKISSYFKGPDGYYILKLEGKKGGKAKSLAEIWDNIKNLLTFLQGQQKINDLVGKISRQAKVEVYEGEIK